MFLGKSLVTLSIFVAVAFVADDDDGDGNDKSWGGEQNGDDDNDDDAADNGDNINLTLFAKFS